MKFVLAAMIAFLGSLILTSESMRIDRQPIDFNHKAHLRKKVNCRECHFICEFNRDEDWEIDCEECIASDLPFCEEHKKCPDHKLPGVPGIRECLRCHSADDLIELKNSDSELLDPSDRKKLVLLDFVELDEEEEEAIVKKEIPWKRLSRLKYSNVYFSHRTHALVAVIACEICHGNIQDRETPVLEQPFEMNMDWCLDCHRKFGATQGCVSCHR